MISFDEYQRLARRTQNMNLSREERERHALHGLASEIGEIHALYQKVYQGHPFDEAHLLSELGDLLWFMGEMADVYHVTLAEIAWRNIEKLRMRFPDGFSEEKSLHRAEGDI